MSLGRSPTDRQANTHIPTRLLVISIAATCMQRNVQRLRPSFALSLSLDFINKPARWRWCHTLAWHISCSKHDYDVADDDVGDDDDGGELKCLQHRAVQLSRSADGKV